MSSKILIYTPQVGLSSCGLVLCVVFLVPTEFLALMPHWHRKVVLMKVVRLLFDAQTSSYPPLKQDVSLITLQIDGASLSSCGNHNRSSVCVEGGNYGNDEEDMIRC